MKKMAVLLFSLMLMLSLPMVTFAATEDSSPQWSSINSKSASTSKSTAKTSPKTYDESMVGLAMAVLFISGTAVCISWKRMRRA